MGRTERLLRVLVGCSVVAASSRAVTSSSTGTRVVSTLASTLVSTLVPALCGEGRAPATGEASGDGVLRLAGPAVMMMMS